METHVVSFSGGVGSYMAAKRAPADAVLLFADTLIEDEDLYRFLDDASERLGRPITRVADGRNPWEVFRDVRFIGNSRVDPCSRMLKRELLRRWIKEHCDPKTTTVYLGIDWTEMHRMAGAAKRWAPWKVEAPMCDRPYLSKPQMLDELRADGLEVPRLYKLGAVHNNCGGFCIKAGHAQFAWLLREMPERYRWHEEQEEALRAELGDVAVLRDRRGGEVRPLTMRALRERIEAGGQIDLLDWGGCGCAVD